MQFQFQNYARLDHIEIQLVDPENYTVNGEAVESAYVFPEDDFYRWIIRSERHEYVDGGNYRTEEAAIEGLKAALR
jgi:hypothetical protein